MDMAGETQLDPRLHWYKDAIIYEVHIKAFKDGDGDGLGDFTGLLEKLDYLHNLGVTAIWLLPFYPSPLKDDGYDIADYYSINPSYGNLKQFKLLLREAHKRQLKVITELVINHTSDQHPWFQRARKAPKGSLMRDVYVWTDDPTDFKDARIIFQDFETSNWTWDPVASQYYWHRFYFHQPDLNYRNPMVRKQVFQIIDYWCRMGVDGFRLDAVPYLYEANGTNCENLPETHAFLKDLRKHLDDSFPGTLMLAEANMWPEDSAAYFGNGDECQMNYHFPVMPRMFMALQMEDRYPLIDIFNQTPAIPETCQWAIFLRNHDELTLEMVTDEERDYMYKMYAKDPKAKINLGIRHRLAPLMEGNRKKIELLNYLLFSLPGTPVIYYGDEIGMGDNFYLGDRDGVRTPMQWSPDRNAGFSSANPQKLYLPVIIDPEYQFSAVNVEMQEQSTSSILWWMKRLINTRKKYKAFGRGTMKFLSGENSKVLAFVRSYQEETILVVVNLSRYAQPAEIDLQEYSGYRPIEVFSNNVFPPVKSEAPYFFTLGSYECGWFLLEKAEPVASEINEMPALVLKNWKDLPEGEAAADLSGAALPAYLMKARWFGGKARNWLRMQIIDHAPVQTGESLAFILLVEVTYDSGLPDIYQLPVAFAGAELAKTLSAESPKAIISKLVLGKEEGLLVDASYLASYQQAVFYAMTRGHELHFKSSSLLFSGNRDLKNYAREHGKIRSRLLAVEQSNTSMVFDSAYFLKLYRKVERAVNPDVEITKFLTDKAHFPSIPAFVGEIEWRFGKESMVLGMMQNLVDASGDGWSYMLDRLDHFNESMLSLVNSSVEARENGSAEFDTSLLPPLKGSLSAPIAYEDLPAAFMPYTDATVAERARLLGQRTGEMHLALASGTQSPDFKPEEFTLHYQRSLYSSLQTLVRSSLTISKRRLGDLTDEVRTQLNEVVELKEAINDRLKQIYSHKLDVVRIRTHGDYHLGQVLFTGKDLVILDFEGEPARSYSERRIKHSPLRDVAGMIRSFHYAAYGSLILDNQVRKADVAKLEPFIAQWYHYMSGFFMKAYLETVSGSAFVPQSPKDLEIMLETYLLQKALYELSYEFNNRPEWLVIPIKGIKSIMMMDPIASPPAV